MWPAGQNSNSWINLSALDEAMNNNMEASPKIIKISAGRQFRMQMLNWFKGGDQKLVVKDEHGNWANTVESVILLDPSKAHTLGNEILPGIKNGTNHNDSITAQKSTEFTEFFSPSGVVDQGLVKTPVAFNPDGTVKTYKETTQWDGADTQKSFFLIANEDMAGQNALSLGFNGNTGVHTDSDDRTPNPAFDFSGAVLTSGAAKHDILIGIDDDAFKDVMFGHGGGDWIQGGAGENLLVGGSGSDKFIIENGAQTPLSSVTMPKPKVEIS